MHGLVRENVVAKDIDGDGWLEVLVFSALGQVHDIIPPGSFSVPWLPSQCSFYDFPGLHLQLS